MNKKTPYNDHFYKAQIKESYEAAKQYVRALSLIHKPKSTADLGCGRGAWLKAFKENGTMTLVGFDGPWNKQEDMIDNSIKFNQVDLKKPLQKNLKQKYDLAISLEVAEHLPLSSAPIFVRNLTSLSDNILFGAAYPMQGGVDHINEQPHSFWANLFLKEGYLPFDLFRSKMWGTSSIPFWYQQNTFFYVKKNTALFKKLKNKKIHPIDNINFMNCVHPELLEMYTNPSYVLKRLLKKLIPQAFVYTLKKIF